MESWIALKALRGTCLSDDDIALFGPPLLAARTMLGADARHMDAQKALGAFAETLRPVPTDNALADARDHLHDEGDSLSEREDLNAAWALIRDADIYAIDWDAEVGVLLETATRWGGISFPACVRNALAEQYAPPANESCYCLFQGSTALAWAMAKHRPITLFGEGSFLGAGIAVLAWAADIPLTVDKRNPVDGSYSPPSDRPANFERSPIDHADHIVSVPPVGLRSHLPNERHARAFEQIQTEYFSKRVRKSFLTIVTDGMLSRDAKSDIAFRRSLATTGALDVISLPAGMFGRATKAQTSLVRWRPASSSTALFINARSTDPKLGLRPGDEKLGLHLRSVLRADTGDAERAVAIPVERLADTQYSLMPERHVQSTRLRFLDQALSKYNMVELGSIADILRPKAPAPCRDDKATNLVMCREITPSELSEGLMLKSERKVFFKESERERIKAVTVELNDILISIKGRVGKVGLFADVMQVVEQQRSGMPNIISQTLAIIRLRQGTRPLTPELLTAILTAPWVTEKLESMSAGATMESLPIGTLKAFRIPLPDRHLSEEVTERLEIIKETRFRINNLRQRVDQDRKSIWSALWNMPTDSIDFMS